MRPLPRSVLLATWGTAALRGHVSPDLASVRVVRDDAPHRVDGVAGEPGSVALTVALSRLRARGSTGMRVALPVPGDAAGLPGPATFNADALDAGEAVLCDGDEALGLVPHVETHGGPGERLVTVRWAVRPVATATPPTGVDHGATLAEAERLLHEGLGETAEALAALDVARWRPDVATRLEALRAPVPAAEALPPGFDPRAHRVMVQARRLEAVVDLALEEPGAAVGATAVRQRTGHLRTLGEQARRAQVAACNSWAERRPG